MGNEEQEQELNQEEQQQEEQQEEQEEQQQDEQQEEQEEQEEQQQDDKKDEFKVTLGEDDEPSIPHGPAPIWVKEMRKQNRELRRKIRDLEQNKAIIEQASTPVVGEKPTLESVEYNTQKYEEELAKWLDSSKKVQEHNARMQAETNERTKRWQDKARAYEKGKESLRANDYEDSEAVVMSTMNTTQQGIIIAGAKNPALFVYALGKNPVKARVLGTIKDPVEFAFAAARLERELQVTDKRVAPKPEKSLASNGRTAGVGSTTLDKLRAEAERTGDYTKVAAYKRQKQRGQ